MTASNDGPVLSNGHNVIPTNGTAKSQARTTQEDHDFSLFRRLVPLMANESITYLNASFAPPSNLIVYEAMSKFLHESLYDTLPKPQWQAAVEDLRGLVARYIHCDASEVAFTRDTTEALAYFARSVPFKPGDNVVLLDTEHPNHAYAWMSLRSAGLEVRQIPTIASAVESGKVVAATAETFAPYVDDRTVAIGLSSIMFHSGQWNDVQGVCEKYRPRGIHVLVDATQQAGFAQLDVRSLGVSAAALSMHKGLNCPTGLAVLYVDTRVIKDLDPTPPIVGYGAVQNCQPDLLVPEDPIVYHPSARRYEHLNLSLIAAAAAKASITFYLDVLGPERVESHLYSLGDALRTACKKVGVEIVRPEGRERHAPHLYILKLSDPRWTDHFKSRGIIMTTYRLGIRVSFGFYNNLQDVEKLVQALHLGLESGLTPS